MTHPLVTLPFHRLLAHADRIFKSVDRVFIAFLLTIAFQAPVALAETGSDDLNPYSAPRESSGRQAVRNSRIVNQADRLMRVLSAYNDSVTPDDSPLEIYEQTCRELSHFIDQPFTGYFTPSAWDTLGLPEMDPGNQFHRGEPDPIIFEVVSSHESLTELQSFHPAVSIPVLALSEYTTLSELRDRINESSPTHWKTALELAVIMKSLTLLNEYSGWSTQFPWRTMGANLAGIVGILWGVEPLMAIVQQAENPTMAAGAVGLGFLAFAASYYSISLQ